MPRYRKPIVYLSKEQISKEARALLVQWSDFIGQKMAPPIPVEAIAEKYLGITLEYDDLGEILGIPDVLGATWVDEKRIVINKTLANERDDGRLNFTCGHEIGHWVLHRNFLSSNTAEPVVICRTSQSKSREEWQADYFSACLLMPAEEVREAYHRAFGSQPLILHNEKSRGPGVAEQGQRRAHSRRQHLLPRICQFPRVSIRLSSYLTTLNNETSYLNCTIIFK